MALRADLVKPARFFLDRRIERYPYAQDSPQFAAVRDTEPYAICAEAIPLHLIVTTAEGDVYCVISAADAPLNAITRLNRRFDFTIDSFVQRGR
jgi:hypothetical protein